MRLLSWTLAMASTCFLAVSAPASAATVLTGTSIDYLLDSVTGDGFAIGMVTDGTDDYSFDLNVILDLLDPVNPIDGDILITLLSGNAPIFLSGFLEEIEVGADYVALLFGTLSGEGAAMLGSKVRVLFTGFDPNGLSGTTSVTVSPIPLPATALLLLSGMAGAMVMARRRKAARQAVRFS